MTRFPYVETPDRLRSRLGLADEGTRMGRAFGGQEAFDEWWEAVCEVCGTDGAVSRGGVAMFAQASKAGVHKRLQEGRLTAFMFHHEKRVRTRFLKRERIQTEGRPLCYIPANECRAWGEQLAKMPRRERRLVSWGDGDHAGQSLLKKRKDK